MSFFIHIPDYILFEDEFIICVNKPAMIVELKYDKDADTAIEQIHRKEYKGKVLEYTNNLLLVGINYDKEAKKHTCVIEKYAEE